MIRGVILAKLFTVRSEGPGFHAQLRDTFQVKSHGPFSQSYRIKDFRLRYQYLAAALQGCEHDCNLTGSGDSLFATHRKCL